MKKTALLLCALLLAALVAGCGGGDTDGDSDGNAGGTPAAAVNYIDVIRNAREDERNAVFYIVADDTTRAEATTTAPPRPGAESGELFETPDADAQEAQQREFIFNAATGLSAEPMERYAISIGFSITQAYGVAIVLPKEGQEQAVADMLNAYVLSQQKAQENYLPDQYAIAKAAVVKTVPSGEVVMVMSDNSAEVLAAIEESLKG